MTIVVGFTGTRTGMTAKQIAWMHILLDAFMWLQKKKAFDKSKCFILHGDCVGADAEFDAIASGHGLNRVIFPCTLENQRAHCERLGAEIGQEPKAPLERNKDIITKSTVLIAAVATKNEVKRSGTWATIRHARKMKKSIFIIYPDGNWNKEEPV